MSDGDDPPSQAGDSPRADVGYGRPPKQHRFKKGVSGNPRGRPRKSKSLPAITVPGLYRLVLDEAYRPVTAREGDTIIELPVIRAVLRSLGVSAMKGSRLSQLALTEMVAAAETKAIEEATAPLDSLIEHKRCIEAVFEQCDREGRPRPEVFPHPDDVIVDLRAGEIEVVGPWDERHKHRWDRMREHRAAYAEEIEHMKEWAANGDDARKAFVKGEIASAQKTCDMIDLFLPDEETRRSPKFDPRERRRRMDEFVADRARRKKTRAG